MTPDQRVQAYKAALMYEGLDEASAHRIAWVLVYGYSS